MSVAPLDLIEQDGLAVREGAVLRTTRKWQRAMARAALRLYEGGDPGEDLRVPIASALLALYGDRMGDEDLAALVVDMADEIRRLRARMRVLGID